MPTRDRYVIQWLDMQSSHICLYHSRSHTIIVRRSQIVNLRGLFIEVICTNRRDYKICLLYWQQRHRIINTPLSLIEMTVYTSIYAVKVNESIYLLHLSTCTSFWCTRCAFTHQFPLWKWIKRYDIYTHEKNKYYYWTSACTAANHLT